MANRSESEEKPTPEDQVRAWLETSGKTLEMDVAAAFMSTDAEVQQSPFYRDHNEDKPREIDVVALYSHPGGTYVVSIEVECKHGAEPFVVVLSSQYDPMQYRCLSRGARMKMPDHNDKVVTDLNGTSLFDPAIRVGHALDTKLSEKQNKDERNKGWQAAVQATTAAHHFATRLDDTDHPECHVAFPVVVTDRLLMTAELINGEWDVKRTNHARFVLKWPFGDATAVLVDVVHASAIPAFAKACSRAAHYLLDRLSPPSK